MSNTYPYEPPKNNPERSKNKIPVWAWVTGGVLVALIIALVVTLVVGTSGGKDDENPAPAPTVTVTEEAEESERETGPTTEAAPNPNAPSQEGFLNLIRDANPVLKDTPDEVILDKAAQTCSMLDEDKPLLDVLYEVGIKDAKSSVEEESFGFIIGFSVSTLCPEHSDELERYM